MWSIGLICSNWRSQNVAIWETEDYIQILSDIPGISNCFLIILEKWKWTNFDTILCIYRRLTKLVRKCIHWQIMKNILISPNAINLIDKFLLITYNSLCISLNDCYVCNLMHAERKKWLEVDIDITFSYSCTISTQENPLALWQLI